MFDSLPVLALGVIVAGLVLLPTLSVVLSRVHRRSLAFDRRLRVARRRAPGRTPASGDRGRDRAAGRGFRRLGLAPLRAVSMLVPIGAREREKLGGLLRGAGFGEDDALSYLLSMKFVCGAAAAAGAGYLASESELLGPHTPLIALAALVGLVTGGIVPEFGVRALATRRLRRMEAAFSNALDLIVMCLDSGLTFERGLTTVADELDVLEPLLAAEFRLLEAELRLGSSRRAVLQDLRARTSVEGLKDLATSLMQAERYGTPLIQSVRNIAAEEREQSAARLVANAERLPVLLTMPMLLLVLPGTMLLIAGPAFTSATRALKSIGG